MAAPYAGFVVKHRAPCPTRNGGTCRCKPSYMAHVWDARAQKRVRKTFDTLAGAKAWRADAHSAMNHGATVAPSKTLLRDAADEWLMGARDGSIRNRSGDVYKPSAIRGYEQALRIRILDDFGGRKLSEITRADLQRFIERMQGAGMDASTIRNTFMPLRVIYRRSVELEDVAVNPTHRLNLPAVRGRRDRIATPDEAAKLIAALPATERGLWATAMYAGLRLGELQALDWQHVDLASGVIRVERSFDPKAGFVEPKSRKGKRTVPIPAVLRDVLDEHKIRGERTAGLVFGRSPDAPPLATTVLARARKAWKEAQLTPIIPHECRHTFASLMIAAGVNPKALSTYMGHANIAITMDRYGHLFPGNENEAAGLLDAYLERAATQARLAAVTVA